MIPDVSLEEGPHFIIAGAQKAGTTSLHHILDQHQNIQMVPGEVNFFSQKDANERPFAEVLRRRGMARLC